MGNKNERQQDMREERRELPGREVVAILDAGAQYGKVIDRRVRNLNVESVMLPLDTPVEELQQYKGIIISGGPQSVYADGAPQCDPRLFTDYNGPILGICYGMQLMVQHGGGKVESLDRREDGPCDIKVNSASALFKGLDSKQEVLMSHGDSITELPNGFMATATSDGIIAAIENKDKKHYGVQFHPEVDLTENGKNMLKSFLYDVAECHGTYTMEDRKQKAIDYIKEKVGDNYVTVLVSGGVDSAVCAALLREALGPQKVLAVHIDNGFMRKDESAKVAKTLRNLGIELQVLSAQEDFYNATTTIRNEQTKPLKKTIDPEDKRKIIGDTFIKITQQEMLRQLLDESNMSLAQGTLRPDLIESASEMASKSADVIKTHHNDTQLVRELRKKGRVIEPLQDYHKDEVRELGLMLGLPEEIVWRQPFPGPGIAIRILCIEEPYIPEAFDTTAIELSRYNTHNTYATLLPVPTVGVQGDGRSYKSLAVITTEGKPNWDELFTMANDIPKRIHLVNRVVYAFGKPIKDPIREIIPTHLTPDAIEGEQEADDVVNQILFKHGLMRSLSQAPVITVPVNFDESGKRAIEFRPIITNDFMTARAAKPGKDIPEAVLQEIVETLLDMEGVSRVLYDMTSKPPATTEWE